MCDLRNARRVAHGARVIDDRERLIAVMAHHHEWSLAAVRG
jgi:hypothetical protein